MSKTQIIQHVPADLGSSGGPAIPTPPKPARPTGVAKTAMISAPSATQLSSDDSQAIAQAHAQAQRARRSAAAGGPAKVFTGVGQEGVAEAARKAREERHAKRRELVTQALQRAALSPDVLSELETGFTKALEDVETVNHDLEKRLAELEKENARLVLEAEDLKVEIRALKALGPDDDAPGERRYTQIELDMQLAEMERACREEAEKALAKTAELAKDKINRWRGEAKRLQALLEGGAAASASDD